MWMQLQQWIVVPSSTGAISVEWDVINELTAINLSLVILFSDTGDLIVI